MNEAVCQGLSEFIGVLSNPYRIKILCALASGEKNVGDIAASVDLPPAHVSSHLRILYDRGYVVRRREWKQVFYALRSDQVGEFLSLAVALSARTEENLRAPAEWNLETVRKEES